MDRCCRSLVIIKSCQSSLWWHSNCETYLSKDENKQDIHDLNLQTWISNCKNMTNPETFEKCNTKLKFMLLRHVLLMIRKMHLYPCCFMDLLWKSSQYMHLLFYGYFMKKVVNICTCCFVDILFKKTKFKKNVVYIYDQHVFQIFAIRLRQQILLLLLYNSPTS